MLFLISPFIKSEFMLVRSLWMGPFNSLRMGPVATKTKLVIRGWELSALPADLGGGGGRGASGELEIEL